MKIGALVIGQSPRPDLTDPLRGAFVGAEIIEVGALDQWSEGVPPAQSTYHSPLSTRLRNGREVVLEEDHLTTHLQASLDQLEANGVSASVLLCAGAFADLKNTRPLIKPFATTKHFLGAVGLHHLLVICPFAEQCRACEAKWKSAGFDVHVQADPGNSYLEQEIAAFLKHHSQTQAIILDYVGYPATRVLALQKNCALPIVDLGQLSIVLASTLYPHLPND